MKKITARSIAVTGVLTAVAFVLMLVEISIPIVPSFLKLDFSDLPELIASFALGPVYGVIVCFLKNAIHLTISSSSCVGEISNFFLGSVFVFTAGIIYDKHKSFKGAIVGSFVGALLMAVICVPVNYYIVYPLYGAVLGFSSDAILGMYKDILPSIKNMWQALIVFNMPFTFVKGLLDVIITFLIYKKLSPILKGKKK